MKLAIHLHQTLMFTPPLHGVDRDVTLYYFFLYLLYSRLSNTFNYEMQLFNSK